MGGPGRDARGEEARHDCCIPGSYHLEITVARAVKKPGRFVAWCQHRWNAPCLLFVAEIDHVTGRVFQRNERHAPLEEPTCLFNVQGLDLSTYSLSRPPAEPSSVLNNLLFSLILLTLHSLPFLENVAAIPALLNPISPPPRNTVMFH
jgi:hypothetical protein